MNQSDVYSLESVTINVEAIWDFHLNHDAILFFPQHFARLFVILQSVYNPTDLCLQILWVKEIIALWKSPDMESCKKLDKNVRKWALFIFYKINQHSAIKQ